MLVLRLQNAEDIAIHICSHTVVGTKEHAVLVLDKELARRAWGMCRLCYTRRDVDIHIRIFIQHCTQTWQVLVHIEVVARDEDGSRVLAKRILKGSHKTLITQAICCGGVHMPNGAIRQTIVGSILWEVHPVWFAYVDIDRHLQLSALCPNWFETWVVDMKTIALGRTCVEVALTLITHLTYTYSAHLMAFLQISDTLVSRAIFEQLGIVKRAPEAEAVGILSIRRHHLFERFANPRAVHDVGFLNTTCVHSLYPSIHFLWSSDIIVRVHINNRVFSLLNKRLRNIIHVYRAKVIQEQGLGDTLRLLLSLAARH